jgi:hypothetical protein
MSVFSAPTREQYGLLKDLPAGRSVHMLNLTRFRIEASYADERKASGRDAYAAYSRQGGPYFKEAGGKIVGEDPFLLRPSVPRRRNGTRSSLLSIPASTTSLECFATPGIERRRLYTGKLPSRIHAL